MSRCTYDINETHSLKPVQNVPSNDLLRAQQRPPLRHRNDCATCEGISKVEVTFW